MTSDVVPLRPYATGPLPDPSRITSSEALVISAFLAVGVFNPGTYGLTVDDLACYEKVWRFAQDYQQTVGRAPTVELVTNKYPDFVYTPQVSLDWAVAQLRQDSYSRAVRRTITEVLTALGEDDYATVATALKDLPRQPSGKVVAGLNAFDPRNMAEEKQKHGMPVPFPSLQEVTGGIGIDESWLIAARTGHGKSQMLVYYASVLVENGYAVRMLSAEMPAEKVNRRLYLSLARGNKRLQIALRSAHEVERLAALDELKTLVAGSFDCVDPSMAPMNMRTVEDATEDVNVVMVDHVGLLQLPNGTRAINDWRTMAEISNTIREINLRTHTAFFNAAQINRQGDSPGLAPPKLSEISQSDALGQDNDVVITHRQPADNFLSHALRKYRDGKERFWYSRFDPAAADYREIDRASAVNLKLAYESRLAGT